MTVEVKKRMHQEEFRDNVLSVYGCQCALCKIRHLPLLDAAHIVPDKHELGLPKITNGLSLCKIHHAAYDANLMGISPDYKIHVKLDLLEEIDGPMLQHGIKELHQAPIQLPKKKYITQQK
ncbi:MAG: HNH endonuclease [Bacteroidetes bacterium]|nr:HNH endonuclease [Bacteroidota bacterium]